MRQERLNLNVISTIPWAEVLDRVKNKKEKLGWKKGLSGGGEGQLSCKPDDLSSNSRTHRKVLGVVVHLCNSNVVMASLETEVGDLTGSSSE